MADQLLGSFVWCELLTTDLPAAESFYTKVVGWTAVPFAPDGSYTVFNNVTGAGVGGLMLLPNEAKQMGAPPNWMIYIGTPNVDDTAMRIAQLGGRVLKQPDSIPTIGRFAVVQDPFGATFCIFTPEPRQGAPVGGFGVGSFSWFELYTPNPEAAWKFYETMFGWEKTSAMDMGEMGTYQMFGRGGGIPSGGIMAPPPGAPAAWMPYIRVKDAKAAVELVKANGGKIVNGPMEVPGGDWIAQGMDPQGAMFSVHSLNPAAAAKETAAEKPARKSVVKTVVKAVKRAVKKVVAKATAGKKAKPAKKKVAKKAVKKSAPKKTAKPAKKKAAKKPAPTSAKASAGKPKKKVAKKAAKRKK